MRATSKKKAALEQVAEEQAALQEIAKIRRNGFNPGDELVNKAIREHGPVRALAVMRLAALADRKWFGEVH